MAAQSTEDQAERILEGSGLQVSTLISASGDVQPVAIRKTVCYIVSAVILSHKNEVLMVQEAKDDCYQEWYLPAGRMELNESIVEGMRREVKEETGFECSPITLLMVEEHGPRWIRFTFLAEITGGSMKTLENSDSESLQAQWWDRISPLSLRAKDILPLIDSGVKYKEKPWFPPTLPTELPCCAVCQRLMVTFLDSDSNLWLLLGLSDGSHLPITVSNDRCHSIMAAPFRLLKECLKLPEVKVKTLGVLGLQHHGKHPGNTDGICFNMLVSVEHADREVNSSTPPVLLSDKYQWWKVDRQCLKDKLLERCGSNAAVPIYSI
ncbi:8-oxo-dGDP phosphatase NUDT18 [Erpetoichthys calabaricus]|uniref:Nudix (nucleoside diphosphate linked moiety X)-type motif 18 n=1 Tax=Erpetoichthys calabaricus TaxID=27687 RepID=A0A8C4RIB6_ERPCA|nr:8-oxo-dGDP phosphatase NUDT18 [Erpetoichthys calabaricus]XP_051778299.1 8-oxo-dGDP phosphatase NUDT18 [Erpetoichthys calabaricus]